MQTPHFRRLPDPSRPLPPLLAAISDAPHQLFIRGRLPAGPCVAIVGSRTCTSYGRATATRLARELAGQGVTVVSGLARGIDAAAHRGALAAGLTVAVLPNGIRRVYPAGHRALAAQIERHGALVAEFDTDEAPAPWHFPRRNRIVAGLSLAVVVVEAGRRSGARITADLALDYGRDVLAVPGNVDSPRSDGCNALLREGARPCTGSADVLDALPAAVRADLATAAEPAGPPPGLDPDAARILEICRAEGVVEVGALARCTGLPIASVLGALVRLEALRLTSPRPGNRVAAAPVVETERG